MKTGLAILTAIVALAVTPTAMSAVIASGTFGPTGHETGRGTVTAVSGKHGARYLKLSSNFVAYNAIRLHLYLATGPSAVVRRDLGAMRRSGAQTFRIPAGVNLRRYKYVIAWCVDFDVPITQAILR